MEGKVKRVVRAVGHKEGTADHWKSDVHSLRITRTYAELYNGKEVNINENQIRSVTGRKNITGKLINNINDKLHNKHIQHDTSGNLLSKLVDLLK